MRLSYVVWQEGVNPYVIVELLSPGTEKEDLGENDAEKLPSKSEDVADNGQAIQAQSEEKPPRKWEVYEQNKLNLRLKKQKLG
jgi:Uma2 family endonuclease